MRKTYKQLAAWALALAGAGAAAEAFNVSQYTNGVPQTTNGVTFVLVTGPGSVAQISNDTRWTANNVYVLDKLTFVGDGATLTIEPGTVVRGERATKLGASINDPADPGTLIVSRGAKIIANGTKESPIVFTSIDDRNVPGGGATIPPVQNGAAFGVLQTNIVGSSTNVIDNRGLPQGYGPVLVAPVLGSTNSGNNGFAYDSQWGGVIVCGKTRIAQNNVSGVDTPVDPTTAGGRNSGVAADFIEGFQTFTGSFSGQYGGTDDDDSSGVMRFLSIRYAGFVLSPGNEINGLTLGGVGRGTVGEFIEIFNNQDDGFEWFGGTINMKYLAALFNGDDNFDWDEGFRGKGQFWFGIQDNTGNYVTSANNFFTEGDTVTGRDQGDGQGDKLIEGDGGENNAGANENEGDNSRPFSIPVVYNATLIGRGWNSYDTTENYVRFRGNSGGKIFNTIVTDCDTNSVGVLRIGGTGLDGSGTLSPDVAKANTNMLTIDRYVWTRTLGDAEGFNPALGPAPSEPDLVLKGLVVYNAVGDANITNRTIQSENRAVVASNLFNAGATGNLINSNPQLLGIGRISTNGAHGTLDPRLAGASPARASAIVAPQDGFFTPVSFRGAFQDHNWLRGWSVLEWLKVFANTNNADDGPAVSIGFNGGGSPVLTFNSVAGILYSIEASPDLKSYSPVSVVTGTGGSMSYTNVGTGTNFFRVIPL